MSQLARPSLPLHIVANPSRPPLGARTHTRAQAQGHAVTQGTAFLTPAFIARDPIPRSLLDVDALGRQRAVRPHPVPNKLASYICRQPESGKAQIHTSACQSELFSYPIAALSVPSPLVAIRTPYKSQPRTHPWNRRPLSLQCMMPARSFSYWSGSIVPLDSRSARFSLVSTHLTSICPSATSSRTLKYRRST